MAWKIPESIHAVNTHTHPSIVITIKMKMFVFSLLLITGWKTNESNFGQKNLINSSDEKYFCEKIDIGPSSVGKILVTDKSIKYWFHDILYQKIQDNMGLQ